MSENRRKKKMDRSKLVKIILTITVVLVLITVGVIILRKKVSEKFAKNEESDIVSASVEKDSISTTVYGSGQLTDDDTEEVKIPDALEIEEYIASAGDAVEEGDILAKVNSQSVITAMAELQSEIDKLDEKLEDAEDDEISSTIKSKVSGRVKQIFAEENQKVISVMYEHNALMVLSADGYMAVDLEDTSCKEGDETTVITSDETEYTGRVRYVSGQTATVVFSDDGPETDDTVVVKDSSGKSIGSGKCYINSPVTVVGYGGTVSSINVKLNSKVYEGTSLISLTDTEDTVDFDTILKERKALEEDLADLMEIYKKGAICASISGSIKTVPDMDDDSSSEDTNRSYVLSPDKTMTVSVSVDETDILSLEVGQEVNVTVESVSEETFEGTITEINKTGTNSDGVTTYTADVQIDKQTGMLEGMSAEASIKIEGVDDALVIPVDALNETSTSAYVYTAYDEENDELSGMVEVTTGLSNSNYIEIKDGLKEGDTVYYEDKSDDNNRFDKGGPGGSFGDFGENGDFPGGSGNVPGSTGFTPPSGSSDGKSHSFSGTGD